MKISEMTRKNPLFYFQYLTTTAKNNESVENGCNQKQPTFFSVIKHFVPETQQVKYSMKCWSFCRAMYTQV